MECALRYGHLDAKPCLREAEFEVIGISSVVTNGGNVATLSYDNRVCRDHIGEVLWRAPVCHNGETPDIVGWLVRPLKENHD